MRRVVICMLSVMTVVGASAQGSKVLNAWGYMEDGEFLKAKEEIEPATVHPKTMEAGKTWYYRGQIYENIYLRSVSPEQFPQYASERSSSLTEAVKSYKKAIELGSNRINMNEVKDRYLKLSNPLFQEGVNDYNKKDFASAVQYFEMSYMIKKESGMTDTSAAYNLALASERVPDLDRAIKYYTVCKELGYQPDKVYSDLAKLYQNSGNDEMAQKTLAEGREKMPNNQALITAQLNIYLTNNEFDKALENLDLAIQNDPGNRILYYARGTIYNERFEKLYSDAATKEQALENFKMAESDYKKAIEVDEAYFDALYNLGALYFNRGAELLNEANLISNDTEYEKAKTAAMGELNKALPYLEKAHTIQPDDKSTMISLRDIYGRTNSVEKYEEMDKKLKN